MYISDIYWLPAVVDKLIEKHQVDPIEVEEIFTGRPQFHRQERGKVQGEDLYIALGQTEAGRYLTVFFIRKVGGIALIISARDIDAGERRQYGRSR